MRFSTHAGTEVLLIGPYPSPDAAELGAIEQAHREMAMASPAPFQYIVHRVASKNVWMQSRRSG